MDYGGKYTSKFTHVHCWMPSCGFSRSRQYVDDEPSMCSSVQVASSTSGRLSSSHSLRSLFLLRFLDNSSAILCSKKERNLQPFSPSLYLPRQLNDRASGCLFLRLISKTDVNCIDISKHPPNLLGASCNPGHSSKSSFVINHKNEI